MVLQSAGNGDLVSLVDGLGQQHLELLHGVYLDPEFRPSVVKRMRDLFNLLISSPYQQVSCVAFRHGVY